MPSFARDILAISALGAALILAGLAIPSAASAQDDLSPSSAAASSAAPYELQVPSNDPMSLRDDDWDLQWNGRLGLGFGSTMGSIGKRFVFETLIRAEALFGRKGDEHPRLGPGVVLRTNTYNSWEMGGALAATFPVVRGFPIFLSAGAGYAWREAKLGGDSGYFEGTFAWGYRSYNHNNRYQVAIQAYVTTRVHTDDVSAYEITGGITFDLALTFGVPGLFTATMLGGDPNRFDSFRDDGEWREEPPPEAAPGFDPSSRAAEYEEDEGADGEATDDEGGAAGPGADDAGGAGAELEPSEAPASGAPSATD